VAPYGLDLSTGLLGQFLGRLLKHVLAPATDHNVRAELEEAVAHRAAESRAATSHQNALALQQVELKHRILNSWPMAHRTASPSRKIFPSRRSAVSKPSVNQPWIPFSSCAASSRLPWPRHRRPRLNAARSSPDFAF